MGIFDRDKQGIDAYHKSLPNYFQHLSEIQAKVSDNRKAAAFLLPIPPGKEKYAACYNLCIEFYFNDSALARKTEEGWGLEFRYPELEIKIKMPGNPVIKTEQSTMPETREIVRGKTVFAEKIVPALDASEFEPFRMIFEQIERILGYLMLPD